MADDRYGHLMWNDTGNSRLAQLGIFDIHLVRRKAADGRKGRFVVVDSPDWVTIVPFVGRNPDVVYTVRQFRHGSGKVTVEFPAGVVHRGERPLLAARRELLEETGCKAGELIHIGSVNPNPAFMNNQIHTYVALELEKVQDLELDEMEILDLEQMTLKSVVEKAGGDEFDNGILLIALQWLARWSEKSVEES
jgi:ADP-ribose pyrophosphatase